MNFVIDISTRRAGPTVVVAVLVLWIGACSSPFGEITDEDRQWVREYAGATSHEPREAEEILDRLAEEAPDDEKRRDARFDRARMALERDDARTARDRFRALVDEEVDDNVDSRARYELGRIAAEHDGDTPEARRILRETILETYPWAGAELALDFLVRLDRDGDRADELVDTLAELSEAVEDHQMSEEDRKGLAAQFHVRRGRVLDEDLDRPDDALVAYRTAHDRCAECAATDEAIYQMGRIYMRLQQWEPAVQALEIVAGRTDRSRFVGTYSSHRASDARRLLGRIEMLYRDDYQQAARHFRTYLEWFDDLPDAHRIAWHLVEIERLDGTDDSYRRALEQFVDNHPYSRHADEARERLNDSS